MGRKEFELQNLYEERWSKHYKNLYAYKKKYGDFNVPKNEFSSLYLWLTKQREYKERSLLSDKRTKMLDKIGFPWSARQQKWENNLKALIEYEKKFKKFAISYDPKYTKLRRWVDWVRKIEHKLTSSRRNDLEKIGFPFRGDLTLKRSEQWEKIYEKLRKHFKKHGHLRLERSSKNMPLINWITSQRKKKNTLSSGQREKLNRINFVWNPQQEINKIWDEKFKELQKFYIKHGHSRVSYQKKEISLRKWMDLQRRHPSSLTAEQLKKLKGVNFEWKVTERIYMDQQWDKQYSSLINFYKKHGHFNVPSSYPENPLLPSWIYQIKNGKINSSGKRGEKLKKINFSW